jgi:hypothetical protein
MTRAKTPLLAAVALLAACPIPQSVPEYPKGTSVTPPRIVAESALPQATLLRVPVGCVIAPIQALSAGIVDEDVTEPVEARWFVDYDPVNQDRSHFEDFSLVATVEQPDPNAPVTARSVLPFAFNPYDFGSTVGEVHVVELVVSNGFDPVADHPPVDGVPARPFRTPLTDFETQVYRWVFLMTGDACP